MKRIIILAIVALLVLPQAVGAVSIIDSLKNGDVDAAKEEFQKRVDDFKDTVAGKLQARGVTMIERRVLDLSRAKNLLTGAVHVTESVKSDLLSKVESNINGLNALRVDLEATEDHEAIKGYVKSIISDYRIYAVFLPQSYGLTVVDREGNFSAKLLELNQKIEEKLPELSAVGIDTSKIQALISNVEADVTAAQVLLDEAEDDFAAMQITDVSGASSLRLSGKQNLVDARAKLQNVLTAYREAVSLVVQNVSQYNSSVE